MAAVLFLDPASVKTGWALMTGARRLVGYGILDAPRSWEAHRRVDKLCDDLRRLVVRLQAEHGMGGTVVMETTSGKTARRLGTNVAGLQVYGMAIGAQRQLLRGSGLVEVVEMVPENQWTKSTTGRQIPKDRRARHVADAFSGYVPADDPGMDAADAIGLGAWWFRARGVG